MLTVLLAIAWVADVAGLVLMLYRITQFAGQPGDAGKSLFIPTGVLLAMLIGSIVLHIRGRDGAALFVAGWPLALIIVLFLVVAIVATTTKGRWN